MHRRYIYISVNIYDITELYKLRDKIFLDGKIEKIEDCKNGSSSPQRTEML